MADNTTEVMLYLEPEGDDDSADLERLTRQLRTQLLSLDVEHVEYVSAGEAPPLTMSGDPVTWGQLALMLAEPTVLVAVIGAIQLWLSRQERKSLTIELDGDKLEIQGEVTADQQPLVDAFLRRHRGFLTTDE